MLETDSLNVQLIEVEGATNPNPEPLSAEALRRLEVLRELYRLPHGTNHEDVTRQSPQLDPGPK